MRAVTSSWSTPRLVGGFFTPPLRIFNAPKSGTQRPYLYVRGALSDGTNSGSFEVDMVDIYPIGGF